MRFKLILPMIVLGTVLICLPSFSNAQSVKEAFRLYNEGRKILDSVKINEDYDRALAKYSQALNIVDKVNHRQGKCFILGDMGTVHLFRSEYDKALKYYENALAVAKELNDKSSLGFAYNLLGQVYSSWGQQDKAISYYKKSLAAYRSLRDLRGEGSALNNIGLAYSKHGYLHEAENSCKKALDISKRIKAQRLESKSLGNLGNILLSWGQYKETIYYYKKSLTVSRLLKNRLDEAHTLGNLGFVFSKLGQYDKALSYYRKDLAICRELNDSKGEAMVLGSLGGIYQNRGDLDKALDYYDKVYKIYKKIKMSTKWPNKLIVDLYLDKQEYQKAQKLLDKTGSNSTRGRFFLLTEQFDKSYDYYGKLIEYGEGARDFDHLFTGYAGQGLSSEKLNDTEGAIENYIKAIETNENTRSSLNPRQREEFFNVRINGFYRTAPYEGLARVLNKTGDKTKALRTIEYTKARVFAEGIASTAENQAHDVPNNVIGRDNQLLDRLSAMKKQLQDAYQKKDKLKIEAVEPQVKKLEKEFEAHKKDLRKKYPLFAATKYPEPLELSDTALKDYEWVISYDVTDPGLLIYLTKGKEIVKSVYKEIPRKEIDELVRKFREPLEIKSGDSVAKKLNEFDFESGKKLADILLGDILSEIPENTNLIIIPDDSLGVLPFEMIVLNEGAKIEEVDGRPQTKDAEFFGDRNPISYYQSLTALTLARTFGKSNKNKSQRLLVMDDPVFDQKDPRVIKLAKAKREELLDSIVNEKLMSAKTEIGLTFPRLELTGELGEQLEEMNKQTDRFTGLKATKTQLTKSKLTKYGSMVFATHGYFGKDLPGVMEPVLVMTLVNQPEGQDGFLRMSEVMGLNLNADVVALTACQTGLGRRISGEGTMGMGRAFQYAGAKSVLMSLWSVSEKASVQLVESFFNNLKEGKSKLEALQLARREIRESGYDHPFFWAPFILVGEVN